MPANLFTLVLMLQREYILHIMSHILADYVRLTSIFLGLQQLFEDGLLPLFVSVLSTP